MNRPLSSNDFQSERPSGDEHTSQFSGDKHIKHVPVRDNSLSSKHEAPLSAYMISPRYLPRNQRPGLPPKRPLGASATEQPKPAASVSSAQPQPVTSRPQTKREPVFYSQAATFGMADRIRRPRLQVQTAPEEVMVATTAEDAESKRTKLAGYIAAGTAAIAATLVLAKDSLLDGGAYVVRKVRAIIGGPSSVNYSATRGTMYRRFGLPGEYWRVGLPVIILILVAVGVAGNLSNGGNNSSGNGNGSGGNNGGTTIQATPTAAAGAAGSGQKGNNASTASGSAANGSQAPTSSPTGSSNTSNTFSGLASGRGGGSPSVSTGSSSLSQATPAPVGGSGGSSGGSTTGGSSASTGSTGTGGSGGGSTGGSGSLLPVTTSTPLPATVTVPSTNTSVGGKGIESTSPINATIN